MPQKIRLQDTNTNRILDKMMLVHAMIKCLSLEMLYLIRLKFWHKMLKVHQLKHRHQLDDFLIEIRVPFLCHVFDGFHLCLMNFC